MLCAMILILTGVARTASTWLEAIFLAVRERYDLGWVPRGPDPYRADLAAGGLRDGHIYAGVFLRWKQLGLETVRHPYRILHVRRDPRDLVVSVYYSMKLSHGAGPMLEQWRARLQSLSEEEGLLAIVEARDFLPPWMEILESFLDKGEADGCHALEFAELVANPYPHLKHYLESAGFEVDPQWFRDVLEARSFERLSGGRPPGEEDVNHHFRKGVTGDWRSHFTPRTIALFKERHGQALIRHGYEKDLGW
jgi:hypothetical protein